MLLSFSKETKIELEFLCKRQNILYNLYFLTRNLKKTVIKITCSVLRNCSQCLFLNLVVNFVEQKN